ncbi:hypothetical protein [Sutcliffiella horikoshii]|uniref:hypothetical protein n=1 Tax=Sutcliffiella horikoshii TaxID=79883 RepID=UPI001F2D706C|nr:hypothetical protein [Sutcliffiella horikoshii]MCG1021554.1 hypothetical protein [Sutcliffiella horikoshii]
MTAITNKFFPLMKNTFTTATKWRPDWNWSELHDVMNAYGIRLIILTSLSPFLTILPALSFKLAHSESSVIGYMLSILMLIPWFIVPFLFIQHITSRSRFGQITSYVYFGIIVTSFILWILFIKI